MIQHVKDRRCASSIPVVSVADPARPAGDDCSVTRAAAEAGMAQRQRQFWMLSACNRTLVHSAGEEELLRDICRALVEIGGYRLAWVAYSEASVDATLEPVVNAAWGKGAPNVFKLGYAHTLGDQTPAARAMRQRTPMIVSDIEDEQWSAAWRAAALESGFVAALAIPLLTGNECPGVLEVYTDQPRAFENSEVGMLIERAAELVFGVTTLRMRRQCQRQQADIARLTRVLKMQRAINFAVMRIRERKLLLQEACRVAVDVGRYSSAVVWTVEPGARYARPGFRAGRKMPKVAPDRLLIDDGRNRDSSLTGRAMRTGQVNVCCDLTVSEQPLIGRELLYADGVRSVVALPFMVDGVPVGALTLTSGDSILMSDDELLLLQDIAASLSFAMRTQKQADAAEYLAHYDPLTGLAKRSLFCRRLDRILQARLSPEQMPAVAVLDIDHLVNLNDGFGRHFGDLLLQQVAERLRHHAGSDDRVGDLGGGTFALVEPARGTGDQGIASLLEETVFAQSFLIEGRSVRVSCRSGLAHYRTDGDDGCTLVQRAEAALKHAKESGEKYLHYRIEMGSAIAERLALEHRLREALDAQQFELHYQPQVNVVTGNIESLEALLRWHDPDQGLVLPNRFLSVLESSGMIIPVGKWVVQRALQDCHRWRCLGLRPVRVGVNVSGVQFRGRAFIDFMLELVDGWSCDPHGFGIDLEITETALLQDIDAAGRQLRELRAAGIRIALDDFGTGYSSLGLLSQLPVDILKIDRSFVKGLPDEHTSMTLTRTIVGLASAFGLLTVAEGVETAEQLEVLRHLNCDMSQGYFHCPPVPVDEIDRLLARNE